MKHLALERKVNSQRDILNPQQEPETPKKLVKKANSQPPAGGNRLKFRYTIIEKPKQSWLGVIFILSWAIIILMLLFSSYHNKLKNLQTGSTQQQAQCRIDYDRNKCQNGLKATQKYCQEKRKCYQSEPTTFYQTKISTSFIAGEIIKDFVDGAGLYVCAAGLVMIWIFIKRAPGKQVKKQYQQYYD